MSQVSSDTLSTHAIDQISFHRSAFCQIVKYCDADLGVFLPHSARHLMVHHYAHAMTGRPYRTPMTIAERYSYVKTRCGKVWREKVHEKNFFSFISIAHHLSTNMTSMYVIVCTKLDGKGDCAIRLCSLTRSFLATSTQHMCSTSSQLASVWSGSECYSAVHCNIMQYHIFTLNRPFAHVFHKQPASLCLGVLWNHNEIHALFLSDPL